MKTMMKLIGLVLLLAAGTAFGSDDGLAAARAMQLAHKTPKVLPTCVVRTSGMVVDAENLLAKDGKCAVLRRGKGGEKPILVVDLGAASLSGYAILHVSGFTGKPVVRVSYACYPEEPVMKNGELMPVLGDDGDFDVHYRASYMGRDVELPALPANLYRHELYTVARTGAIVAPMLMPQARYARITLDTDESSVELDAVEWFVGKTYDRQPLVGYFRSSDPDLDSHWHMGVWTAQFSTLRDVQAWRTVEGLLLPRRLEKGGEVGLTKASFELPVGRFRSRFEFRKIPEHRDAAGFALFASGRDDALLVSLDEGGVLKYVRRLAGRDNVLAEVRLPNLAFDDCVPHEIEFSFCPMKEKLFLSKGTDIAVSIDGKQVDLFKYYHDRQGGRFGFWTPKWRWAVYDRVEIAAADGRILLADDFEDETLAKWTFDRPEPIVADGAKRDRLIWIGDLWWAGRNLYYAVADNFGMRGSLQLLARAQTPEGYVQSCPWPEQPRPAPRDWGAFESDEFAAWFVPVLWEYYLYTGDKLTLAQLYPALVRLMDYLDAHTGKDGLFEQRLETSKSAFGPALQLGDVRHRAYMDMLLYACRQQASAMAKDMGDVVRAKKWAAGAAATRDAVNAHYWDASAGCFRDAKEDWILVWDNDAMTTYKTNSPCLFGPECNSMALVSGLATPAQAATLKDRIVQAEVIKVLVMGAIGKAQYGFGDEAWNTVSTNRWKVLTEKGWDGPLCSQEGMNVDFRPGCGDQSHPDTALAGFISGAFLGVVPVEPGFRRFRFEPHPYAKLRFAEGRVPTPYGAIDARWERTAEGGFRVMLTVPAGTTADIVFPGRADGETHELAPGHYEFVFRK